jgi:hypothetical protein
MDREALERSSPQQVGVIPTEGLAAGGTEVVPVVIADVEWARTPLFLRDSDSMDTPFALEAGKDSKEDLGEDLGRSSRNEGSRNENKGSGSEDGNDGSLGAMDGDVMVE